MYNFLNICGHGQGDSGAVGNGYKEFERTRTFVKYFDKAMNEYENVNCETYDTNTSLSNSKDVFQLGNIGKLTEGKDQCFEWHLNASTSSSANGEEVLVFLNGKDEIDVAVEKALSIFFTKRGFKDGSWLFNANNAKCPYRLIEICFISNKNDVNILNSKMELIAEKIAEKIADVYNLKKKNDVKYYLNITKDDSQTNSRYYNPEAYLDFQVVNDTYIFKSKNTNDKYPDTKKSLVGEKFYGLKYAGKTEENGYIYYWEKGVNQHGNVYYMVYKKVKK